MAWASDEEWLARAETCARRSQDAIRDFLAEQGLSDYQAGQLAYRYVGAAFFYSGALELDHPGSSQSPIGTVRSPIEGIFLLASAGKTFVHNIEIAHEPPGYEPYRPDFELVRGAELLVVELDGHEFHQKTREQVEHDKRRDRWFAAQGYRVIRFTGSEVWRDPDACVDEAIGFFTEGGGA